MKIIRSISTCPFFNIAAEEYLLTQLHDDFLFLYVNDPSVIIGYNQAILNEVDLNYCIENDIQIVRRKSGGGTVFHDDGNLNFCFITNKIGIYSNFNFLKPIVDILKLIGVKVVVGKRKDLWLQNKYKISGSASHITKTRELHHCTLLYDSHLVMLANSLNAVNKDESIKAVASVRSTVKNLKSWLEENGHKTLNSAEFFDFFTRKLLELYQQSSLIQLTENDIEQINFLADNKYSSNSWTHKK